MSANDTSRALSRRALISTSALAAATGLTVIPAVATLDVALDPAEENFFLWLAGLRHRSETPFTTSEEENRLFDEVRVFETRMLATPTTTTKGLVLMLHALCSCDESSKTLVKEQEAERNSSVWTVQASLRCLLPLMPPGRLVDLAMDYLSQPDRPIGKTALFQLWHDYDRWHALAVVGLARWAPSQTASATGDANDAA